MRITFTLEIERWRKPEPYREESHGTTASHIELDGQTDAGELKAQKLQQPGMGFRAHKETT